MILAAAALHLAAGSPSFDCSRATVKVEAMICADEARAVEDRAIARLYRLARTGNSRVRAQQLAYLKERNSCPDPSCLIDRQEQRIGELVGQVPAAGSFRMGRHGTLSIVALGGGLHAFNVRNLWVGRSAGDVRDAGASGAFMLVAGKGERPPLGNVLPGWRLTRIRGGWTVRCLPGIDRCGGVNATIDGDYR